MSGMDHISRFTRLYFFYLVVAACCAFGIFVLMEIALLFKYLDISSSAKFAHWIALSILVLGLVNLLSMSPLIVVMRVAERRFPHVLQTLVSKLGRFRRNLHDPHEHSSARRNESESTFEFVFTTSDRVVMRTGSASRKDLENASDLSLLAAQLQQLREALRHQLPGPQREAALALLAEIEEFVGQNRMQSSDVQSTIARLKVTGALVLEIAEEIGAQVAAKAIRSVLDH
jgi:hypothetical protein